MLVIWNVSINAEPLTGSNVDACPLTLLPATFTIWDLGPCRRNDSYATGSIRSELVSACLYTQLISMIWPPHWHLLPRRGEHAFKAVL